MAEGPETGLSAWAATGRETWIALGSMAKLRPPPQRALVACADDDPRAAVATKALRHALVRWRDEGRDIAVALPWQPRRHDGSDFNDLLQRDGIEAVRARIEAASAPALPAFPKPVPVGVSRTRLRLALAGFFDAWRAREVSADPAAVPPFATAIRASVGLGKSTMALRLVVQLLTELRECGDLRAIVLAMPTHKLAQQLVEKFNALLAARAAGLHADIFSGRRRTTPTTPGETMCRNLAAVKDALRVGADVETSVCKKGDAECPFHGVCGTQKQKHKQADFWFVAHELIFHTKPKVIGELAALIVDESPYAPPWKA